MGWDGWMGWDGMVIIGHRSSKSTFGAYNSHQSRYWFLTLSLPPKERKRNTEDKIQNQEIQNQEIKPFVYSIWNYLTCKIVFFSRHTLTL